MLRFFDTYTRRKGQQYFYILPDKKWQVFDISDLIRDSRENKTINIVNGENAKNTFTLIVGNLDILLFTIGVFFGKSICIFSRL